MMSAGQPPRCCGGAFAERSNTAQPPAVTTAGAPSREPVAFRWSATLGGTFLMGSPDAGGFPADGEGPVREVGLSPYRIACYAVTNAQFADFVRDTGYTTEAERYGWSFAFRNSVSAKAHDRVRRAPADTPWWLAVPRAFWAQPEGLGSTVLDRMHHPVVHVSWNDAQAYCHWSRTRLPTEAEWEYAARGGLVQQRYPWGDELMAGGAHHCNIWQGRFPELDTGEDGYRSTAPVNAFQPNGFGLYNMVGNVWEWCADVFSSTYHQETATTDPLFSGWGSTRALRGGSFLCHVSYCNRYRVAARSSNAKDTSASNIGFRVVNPPEI
jgi:formylglycine-generating enzyme required for sulfatase activity